MVPDSVQTPVDPTAQPVVPTTAAEQTAPATTQDASAPVADVQSTTVADVPAPAADAPTPPEAEAPDEAAAEPAEEAAPGTPAVPATATTPEVPPVGDKDGDAVADEAARVARVEAAAVAEQANLARDLSPVEEVAASTDGRIDGSNIGLTTNDDIIASLPKNEQGQVEIDEDGQVVGLDPANQPTPPTA